MDSPWIDGPLIIPYDEGVLDCNDGFELYQNPFPPCTPAWDEYQLGWLAARARLYDSEEGEG